MENSSKAYQLITGPDGDKNKGTHYMYYFDKDSAAWASGKDKGPFRMEVREHFSSSIPTWYHILIVEEKEEVDMYHV